MESFELVERLAGAGELDRFAGDRAHRKRGAAARVAVHPGQDHAREFDVSGKALGDVDRILSGQAVDHQQGLGRTRGGLDRLHLGHQRIVDVEAAGGIKQQHVIALQLRRLQRALGDVDWRLAGNDWQRIDLGLAPEHRKLLLRRGPSDIEARHQHLFAIALR